MFKYLKWFTEIYRGFTDASYLLLKNDRAIFDKKITDKSSVRKGIRPAKLICLVLQAMIIFF